jgi:hypothetical protein
MTVNHHVSTFAGRPVQPPPPDGEEPADPGAVAWRIDTDYDGGPQLFDERLTALLDSAWAGRVRALVIGEWGESYDTAAPIERLVAEASTLTSLTALFLGDITYDEAEISWISQDDVTPLLEAYPRLEVLTVRGAGVGLRPVRHTALRELTFQSGGLPAEIARSLGQSELPALTHLELWLGTENYGGNTRGPDLTALLSGAGLPSLKYLGLRDAEIADEVAAELAGAPIVAQLESLDLSMGILSDAGATALLAGQPLTHLKVLDLHHHYISPPVMQRLRAELGAAGVEVDLDDAGDEDDDDRYVEVAE